MSDANKQLTKRWFEEVWNKGRREAIAEILAPEAEILESGEVVRGPEGFYPFFDRMHGAFSEIHVTFHDAIAEADKVCLRWSCSMKHTGDGLGTPATHKNLTTTGISVVRIANGKFVAGWQNWDMLGLMQQIKQEPMAPTYMAAKMKKGFSG
jgi:steroid delta-isomerase-like uncharacterized protein